MGNIKKTLSLQEIQKIELSILIEFDKFCKENNLQYFLCGGTLLGAVRHNGFIPWDDDIDVCMPRQDYEKFFTLTAFKPIRKNLITSTYKKCLNCISYPFIKLIDVNTVLVEQGKTQKGRSGVFIDILPIDGTPNLIEAQKIFYGKALQMRKKILFANTLITLSNSKNIITFSYKKMKQFYQSLFIKKLCKQLDLYSKQIDYDTAENVGIVLWGLYNESEVIPKSQMTAITVQFEGCSFYSFEYQKSYLRNLYGDYMKLPPVDKRGSHQMTAYMLNEE